MMEPKDAVESLEAVVIGAGLIAVFAAWFVPLALKQRRIAREKRAAQAGGER